MRNLQGILVVLALLPLAYAVQLEFGTMEITEGSIASKTVTKFPYGGVNGTINMRLAGSDVIPDSVWLLPGNYTMEQFKFVNQMTLPSELNITKGCRTSVYYNSSIGNAYKAGVESNGDYCIVAVQGTYRIVVEY